MLKKFTGDFMSRCEKETLKKEKNLNATFAKKTQNPKKQDLL